MKPSYREQLECLGRHFDAIRETQAESARVDARLAEQVDQARRFAEVLALDAVQAAKDKAREGPPAISGVTAGVPRARWDAAMVAKREFVTELACTLRLPVRSTETLIAESQTLMNELPATRAALQDGSITYRHAQAIMNQAWSLPAEALAGFEEALLKSAPHLTVANLKYKARVMRERQHPESITARHQKSVADRKVVFEPEPDGMASLYWFDSAEKVKAGYDRLTVMGMSLQGPNETRALTQLRADVFEDLILDGVTASGVGKGIRGSVHVTVPVMTLLGHSEEPGHLEGYGPIDPDTAREIAARAPGFIRVLIHPETGVVLSVGRTRYKVPKELRRYLRVRDETCRWPGCRRAATQCDIDHTLDWQFDGLTEHDNLAHLCPADHALKSETRWTYMHLPDGTLKWTSPTGRTFISEPATIIRAPERRPKPEPHPGPPPRPSSDARSRPPEANEPPPF
ncbi:HNH endonuclease signature motif containing protein [Cryobacterium sp. M96]|uniref:HNH endonuclease signature motif containing protein n=1 Tax=Cryobacterium sp. M96 TaxID=2048295 RepID=UPI000CE32D3C|nr:HNH endonuclease signature motif containing protein [Cryobacterium sp. M96]